MVITLAILNFTFTYHLCNRNPYIQTYITIYIIYKKYDIALYIAIQIYQKRSKKKKKMENYHV